MVLKIRICNERYIRQPALELSHELRAQGKGFVIIGYLITVQHPWFISPLAPPSYLEYNARSPQRERNVRRTTIVALLLFAVLSLVLTYPLAFHLDDVVEDRQDALLNVWITAWDGHQLLTDPVHLFDANIFSPYPRTLAYSELLLGNGALALPITAASHNPVLGYNLALFLSFVLSGFGTYLLVLKLTRSPSAGWVAGIIYAFNSYRMTNLAQAQLLTSQWIPLALLALHQLMRRPRLRHAATFVLFFCLQALSSFYYGILLAFAALGFSIFDCGLWIWPRITHHAPRSPCPSSLGYLFLAACCCVLVILPFALPYFQVQRDLGFERSLDDSEPFSASLRQYLMVPPGSVVHGRWLPSDNTPITGGYPVDALFPGFVALALGFWGLLRGRGRTRWFFFLLLLASLLLSLGPRLYLAPGQPANLNLTLPYTWLYAVVPGFKALRAPVRFDVLVMLSLAVLTSYGVASLLSSRRIANPTLALPDCKSGANREGVTLRRAWIPTLLAGLVVLESLVWPAAHAEPVPVGRQVSPLYRWLAGQPPGPVLELPMAFTPGGPQLDYQYLSTYHWHPTPDGYSGFIPPKHGQIVYEMECFPSERSLSLLQALDVRYVVIHTGRYPTSDWLETQNALAQVGNLTLVEIFGADRVYLVRPRSFVVEDLRVRGYLPPRATAGQAYSAYAIAVNSGAQSYAIQPTQVLHPTAMWETVDRTVATGTAADVPLVTSPNGGAVVIPLPLTAPVRPGTYRLTLSERGGPLGNWVLDGTVEVGAQLSAHAEAFPVPAQLVAWTVLPKAHPGQPLSVSLTWRASGKIDAYYSIYVKLLDAQGNAISGWDGQPHNGEAPTLLWVPGETIEDVVTLIVPPSAPPGDYTIEAGMYRAEDLARCLTLDEDGVPVDRVVLGTVRIEP